MIPFFRHEKAELETFQRVMEKGDFILGEEVKLFEQEVASFIGTKYAIGVNSGTDALKIALRCLNIGEGDEVITTPFTFWATTEAIMSVQAKPVFIDIKDDFNIDEELIKQAITERTKVILPVHMFGNPCNVYTIKEIANNYNLRVVEDCAQAFGGKHGAFCLGSFDVGCFSFFPTKILGGYGDGGMITTNNLQVYKEARILRNHGFLHKHAAVMLGYNSRLDTLQAAFLREKLKNINSNIAMRGQIAILYDSILIDQIKKPDLLDSGFDYYKINISAFNYYTIQVENRDGLKKYLAENEVETQVYYPRLITDNLICPSRNNFKNARRICDRVLSLPIYPGLKSSEVTEIAGLVNKYAGRSNE